MSRWARACGDGALPPPLAVALLRQACRSVGAAHHVGIVHRDLKPDNLFLVRDPDVPFGVRAKVLDFGIAKLMRPGEPPEFSTIAGSSLGTPAYMSPLRLFDLLPGRRVECKTEANGDVYMGRARARSRASPSAWRPASPGTRALQSTAAASERRNAGAAAAPVCGGGHVAQNVHEHVKGKVAVRNGDSTARSRQHVLPEASRPLAERVGATYILWMKRLPIDVWSDIVCPWCYIGKRRLEAALSRFRHRDAVDVRWHAFELDPSAPRVRDAAVPYARRLAQKYATSVGEAEAMIRRMTDVAAEEGLDFHFERVRSGNTFDAHRVLHLAGGRGIQDAVKERLLRAYMTEGEPIGDREVLARLAGEAGLDAPEVRAMLATDAHASEVRADEEEAQALGITGVPFFVLGGTYAVAGAQPADRLLRALETSWAELPDTLAAASDQATACRPDGGS